jgi:hypothetical protein
MYGEDAYEAMGPVPTLAPGEQLLWRGKPKKSAYIADKAPEHVAHCGDLADL